MVIRYKIHCIYPQRFYWITLPERDQCICRQRRNVDYHRIIDGKIDFLAINLRLGIKRFLFFYFYTHADFFSFVFFNCMCNIYFILSCKKFFIFPKLRNLYLKSSVTFLIDNSKLNVRIYSKQNHILYLKVHYVDFLNLWLDVFASYNMGIITCELSISKY